MSTDPARELLDTINRNYVMENVNKMGGPYVADSALSVIQTTLTAAAHQAYWLGYDRGVSDGNGGGHAMPEPRFTT